MLNKQAGKNPIITKKEILFNTSYQFVGKSISLLLVLLSTTLLRRYFGRAGYGNYTFIFSFVLLFSILSDFGTRLTTVPHAAQSKSQQEHVLGISTVTRFLLLVIAFNLYLLVGLFIPLEHSLRLALIMGGGLLFVFWLRDTFYMIFTVKMRLEYQIVVELGVGLLTAAAAALTIYYHQNLAFLFFLINLLSLIFLIGFWYINRLSRQIPLIFNYHKAKELIKKSSLVFGSLFFFTLSAQMPQLVLKLLGSAENLGIFGLSYKIYENGLLPASVFMNTCLPVFSRIDFNKRAETHRLLQNIFDTTILLSMVIVAVLILIAPLGILVLTGSFLKPEILITRLLGLVMMIAYLNHFFGFLMLGRKLIKELFASKVIGFIVGGIVIIPLLKRYSYQGAVYYSLIVELTVLLYSNFICRKQLKFLPQPLNFPSTLVKIIRSKGRVLVA